MPAKINAVPYQVGAKLKFFSKEQLDEMVSKRRIRRSDIYLSLIDKVGEIVHVAPQNITVIYNQGEGKGLIHLSLNMKIITSYPELLYIP
jgi:hypothetical protein